MNVVYQSWSEGEMEGGIKGKGVTVVSSDQGWLDEWREGWMDGWRHSTNNTNFKWYLMKNIFKKWIVWWDVWMYGSMDGLDGCCLSLLRVFSFLTWLPHWPVCRWTISLIFDDKKVKGWRRGKESVWSGVEWSGVGRCRQRKKETAEVLNRVCLWFNVAGEVCVWLVVVIKLFKYLTNKHHQSHSHTFLLGCLIFFLEIYLL